MYYIDKSIVEYLEIERGFSIWWMTLLAEKSPVKSKVPLDCLRLLAVNHFLLNKNPFKLFFLDVFHLLNITLSKTVNLNRE